ncbi:unnamed protein product [Eruca vesicaria subsp. sativa]|uniref:Ubiquitin-conjugating enzyme E2 32 n=1 Tax=Eruca vesicaria subsp. sativa TaxID=29727 RepID=A0ABC8L074_ERUVS|nr:unnamed protein product [Eruca vesicaria subsp. sativa]
MADEKYNRKNPAVKRILQEVKEMQANPSDDFMSLPLEENIFEWQFAIRGPADTEFEVRTALVALIAFMPTSPNGALGSVEYPKEERRTLAIKSREAPPKYGSPERQKVIDEIHHYILSKATVVSKPLPLECNQIPSTESVVHSQTEPQEAITVVEAPSTATADTIADDQIIEEAVNTTANVSPTAATVEVAARASGSGEQTMVRRAAQKPVDDRLFTLAAVGLTMAIMVLLLKKFIRSSGYGTGFMDES